MSVVEIPKWDASEDALCLPYLTIHCGREGQDLGLPLLHVLGKELGAIVLDMIDHKQVFILINSCDVMRHLSGW